LRTLVKIYNIEAARFEPPFFLEKIMKLSQNLAEGKLVLDLDCGPVNAFARKDIEAFEKAIGEADAGFGAYRILIIQSKKMTPKGKPIFCSGADQRERAAWTRDSVAPYVAYERSVIMRIKKSPICVICLVDGYALGLGAEICAAADFVFASPRARFGFPEATLGLLPGAGGTAWCIQNRDAYNHVMLGDQFDRVEAKRIGLVSEFYESAQDAELKINALNTALSRTSPYSQKALKQARYEAWMDSDILKYEGRAYREAFEHKIM